MSTIATVGSWALPIDDRVVSSSDDRCGASGDRPSGVPDVEAVAGALFDRSATPKMILDVQRRQVLRANAATQRLLGLDESSILGRPAREFLLDPGPDGVLRVRSLLGLGTAAVRSVQTPTGPRIVEIDVIPTHLDGVVVVEAIDRTDALQAAQCAQGVADALAIRTEQLERVAARMAHDLRSPLTAIGGFARLLGARCDGMDDAAAEMLARIAANVDALSSMIDAILEDAQEPDPHARPQSRHVDELVRFVRSVVDAQLREANGELVIDVDVDELPVPSSAVQQAVVNMVTNSIRYRDECRPLRIELAVRPHQEHVDIVVADNGRGLDGCDSDAIFASGRRGSSAHGTVGSGLGLAIVRDLVERAGGSVEAAESDLGATFVIHLDANPPTGETEPPVDDTAGTLATGLTTGLLERIIDGDPLATFVIDLDRRQVVRINQAAIDLIGRPRREIVGRPARDLLQSPEIADQLRLDVLHDQSRPHTATARVVRHDGITPVWVAISAVRSTTMAVAHAIPISELALDAPRVET